MSQRVARVWLVALLALAWAVPSARGDDVIGVEVSVSPERVRVLERVTACVRVLAPVGWRVRAGVEALTEGLVYQDVALLGAEGESGHTEGGQLSIVSNTLRRTTEGDRVVWSWEIVAEGYAPGRVVFGPWPIVAERVGTEESVSAMARSVTVEVESLLAGGGAGEGFESASLREGVVPVREPVRWWVVVVAVLLGAVVVGLGSWLVVARWRSGAGARRVHRRFAELRASIDPDQPGSCLGALRDALELAGVERAGALSGPELAASVERVLGDVCDVRVREAGVRVCRACERALYDPAYNKGLPTEDAGVVLEHLERRACAAIEGGAS